MSEPECPQCGEDMVLRKNRKTGEQFYGCPMYPQCDGTEPYRAEQRADIHAESNYPDWAKTNT